MVNPSINDRRQTDTAIARRSESHQIGLARQFSLANVMVSHLPRKQRAGLIVAPNKDQFFIWS
jgi:hypothetical protein